MALKKLAVADVKGEISNASTQFDGALNGLATTLKKKEEAQASIAIITTAISEIGQQIVEAKKRNAIKVIIEKAHPYVEQAGGLVIGEFDPTPDLKNNPKASLLAFNALKSIRAQEATPKEEYDKSHKNLSLEDRLALLEQIRQKHNAGTSAKVFFRKVSLGTEQMVAAHKILKDAVSKDKFSTSEVVLAVSELINTATTLKKQLNGISQ